MRGVPSLKLELAVSRKPHRHRGRDRPDEPLPCAVKAGKIVTAEELEKMTPAQRQAAFDASIVTDLDDAPPELLERTRERVQRMIRESDSPSTT